MRKIGIYLIYAAVVLRGLVRLAGEPGFGQALVLLVLYGVLLALAETRLVQRGAPRLSRAEQSRPATGQTHLDSDSERRHPEPVEGASASSLRQALGARSGWEAGVGHLVRTNAVALRLPLTSAGEPLQVEFWLSLVYLLLQTGLVVGLLLVPPILDFFGFLFIPLCLQAVFLYGRRIGFVWIGLFSLGMAGPMLIDEKGWVFGLTMTVLNIGYCFLFSGYAHQVQRSEAVRERNEQILGELGVAHRQLQGYAVQLEGLAAERERSRLARELHDSVTQTVFSMSLTVQSARLLLEREPDRVAGQLVRLEELAASAMGEIQALVSQLRSQSLTVEGLPAALRRLAAERQARDGLQVTVEVDGETQLGRGTEQALPEPVAEGLLLIAQEALTNVAKHAGTGQATMRLSLGPGTSALEVEDSGLGFDPQATLGQHGHLGLASMAERAAEIGWRLSVESEPGGGTRIRVLEDQPGGAA